MSAFEMPLAVTPAGWALPLSYFEELDIAVRKQTQTIVELAVQKLKSKPNKTFTVEGQFLPGLPKSVILDEAEKWGADLIVVGSHGHSAWGRFLMGSVSLSVVSHAKCSVEVVRCRNANELSGRPSGKTSRE